MQGLQLAVELLCYGDVWALGIERNPMFSRTKWLPATMKGGFDRFVSGRVLHCKVQLRRADRIVVAASMLWIADLVNAVVV